MEELCGLVIELIQSAKSKQFLWKKVQLFIQQLYTHIWFNPLSVDMLVSILVQNLGRWPCWCQSGKEDKICVKKEMHFNFFLSWFWLNILCFGLFDILCFGLFEILCRQNPGLLAIFLFHSVEVWFWCGFWGWDGGGVDVGGKTHQKEE